jgi:uncharacterized membrane protein YdjX (TVP38/TMEM64 family)
MTDPAPPPSGRHTLVQHPWVRLALLAFLLAGTILVADQLGLWEWFTATRIRASLHLLQQVNARLGILGPLLTTLAAAAAIICNVPALVLIALLALLHGPFVGFATSLIALALAMLVIHTISQALGAEAVQALLKRFAPPRLFGLLGADQPHSLLTIINARLVFFAFPPLNWMLAVLPISRMSFILGTLIGGLPHVLLYTLLGDAVVTAIEHSDQEAAWLSPRLWGPILAGLFFAILLYGIRRLARGRMMP